VEKKNDNINTFLLETGVGIDGDGVGVSPDPTDGGPPSIESSIRSEASGSLLVRGDAS
jgi:hypothetical protein